MQILNALNQLPEKLTRLILFQLLLLHDMFEQLAFCHVFHHKEQLFGSLYDLVELDEVWVTDLFQDVDFAGYALDVCHVDYLGFLQDFYGHFLLAYAVDA